MLAIAAATAIIDDIRLHQQLTGSSAQLSVLEARVTQSAANLKAEETNAEALKSEVEKLEGLVGDLKVAAASVKPQVLHIASFLLAAPMHNIDAPPLFYLADDVEQVSVRLALDETDFTQFRVRLMTRGNDKPLWESSTVVPEHGKEGNALKVTVPVDRLTTGSFRFDIAGLDQDHSEPVATYPFSVNRAGDEHAQPPQQPQQPQQPRN
ncbi:MAG TPA: hypothetical protein VGI93_01705 [Steroidobacteraceae bacterium]